MTSAEAVPGLSQKKNYTFKWICSALSWNKVILIRDPLLLEALHRRVSSSRSQTLWFPSSRRRRYYTILAYYLYNSYVDRQQRRVVVPVFCTNTKSIQCKMRVKFRFSIKINTVEKDYYFKLIFVCVYIRFSIAGIEGLERSWAEINSSCSTRKVNTKWSNLISLAWDTIRDLLLFYYFLFDHHYYWSSFDVWL